MGEPIIPNEWTGSDDGEPWKVVVEHDRMERGEPFVVTVEVFNESESEKICGFVGLTPDEAREMASALTVYSFFADRENRDRAAAEAAVDLPAMHRDAVASYEGEADDAS